jgi:hypothetical protein
MKIPKREKKGERKKWEKFFFSIISENAGFS